MPAALLATSALALLLAAPAGDPEAEFRALLAKAKADPAEADFKALRLAFTRTDAYRPDLRGEFDPGPVIQELKNGEREAARVALDRVMRGHWVDPEAHDFACNAWRQIGDEAKVALHLSFLERLVESILDDGDGRTFDTAWSVIRDAEELVVLSILGVEQEYTQALVEHDGHRFDVLTLKDERTGKPVEIYFNVDIPHEWLRENLKPKAGAEPKEPQP